MDIVPGGVGHIVPGGVGDIVPGGVGDRGEASVITDPVTTLTPLF